MVDHGLAGSNGHSQERLLLRLRDQAEDIQKLTAGLDEELLARRPVPEDWSLKELVGHLWRIQEVFEMRVGAMLTETNPAIVPYGPDGDEEFAKKLKCSCVELVNGLLADREEFLALLESLAPSDWRHQGRHPEYRRYDVQFAVEYLMHHEAHHIYQMFQRRPVDAKPKP